MGACRSRSGSCQIGGIRGVVGVGRRSDRCQDNRGWGTGTMGCLVDECADGIVSSRGVGKGRCKDSKNHISLSVFLRTNYPYSLEVNFTNPQQRDDPVTRTFSRHKGGGPGVQFVRYQSQAIQHASSELMSPHPTAKDVASTSEDNSIGN